MKESEAQDVERYLSTRELMAMIGISRSPVYRLMVWGMPYIMVGSVHRSPNQQVLKWLYDKRRMEEKKGGARKLVGKALYGEALRASPRLSITGITP